ncbi:MAG: hypothetical protein WCT10_04095 [Patescibacteria group bacterium]|jgi:hypothetical protein
MYFGPQFQSERRQVYRLMHQIYTLLNSGEWSVCYARIGENYRMQEMFGLNPDSVGFCEPIDQIMYIDPCCDVLATLIHECLHAIFPDKTEDDIIKLEEMIMRHLTPTQARRLHMISAEALIY